MPLTDLGTGTYNGFSGGLYPGGSNTRPAAHQSAGLGIAAQIRPRDAVGNVDPTGGRIGFASLGMSNTTMEFQAFMALAGGDPAVNPRLALVDGAQGGMTASLWADPTNSVWTVFASRLAAAGVAGPQLQVVWLKLAEPAPNMAPGFPAGAQQLRDWIRQTILNLKSKYPSVRIVYLSSRIYAGYATSTLNPEPIAYENGFSVKWVIEAQIGGDPALSYQSASAPWLSWGPYLWADGLTARSDGLQWLCSEFASDGTHPSPQGEQKVAQRLLSWFRADSTSGPWFLANPTSGSGGNAASGGSGGGGGGGACGLVGLDALLVLGILGVLRR